MYEKSTVEVYQVPLHNRIGSHIFFDKDLAEVCAEEENSEVYTVDAYLTPHDYQELEVNGYVWY